MALPRRRSYDSVSNGASTIVILVVSMMLGQCMIPVIASDKGDYTWSDGAYSF